MTKTAAKVDLNTIASLCKRRGFIFQSSEIYGGLASTWDYGPLGAELKRNIKEAWWQTMVYGRGDVVGLDAAILMHPDVWRASGHVESFTDPLVECKQCHQRWRADRLHLGIVDFVGDPSKAYLTVEAEDKASGDDKLRARAEELSREKGKPIVDFLPAGNPQAGLLLRAYPCPSCRTVGSLTEPRTFNLMFRTQMGPVEDEASVAYLRPETAQGIFVNFGNVLTATRRKLPFGIAQTGKAFRNEITTGNFIFRTREFEIMELEFFVRPGEDEEWHRRWTEQSMEWYTALGISEDRLRLRAHGPDELAHYSTATSDIEYLYPWGWGEISGIANRTDFDLKAHSESTGEQLTYFDDETDQHITPYVIEPTFGVDRAVMTFLVDSYTEEEAPTAGGKTERRVVLKLHAALAPVKVAVLPLSRNERLVPLAREVYDTVRRSGVRGLVQYDDAQSIGRRYRRQDEIGTPLCVTVDFDSLDDSAVTIRERDSMAQVRVAIAELAGELKGRLEAHPSVP